MPRPNNVGIGTALILFNNLGQVLLGKRRGSHRAGYYSVPGGWLDREDKSIEAAVVRETAEETGVTVSTAQPFCWTTEDHPEIGVRTVTLFHTSYTNDWLGIPQLMEPEKCEGWYWYDLSNLPSPLFPCVQTALDKFDE